jgi:DNA-binding NtrC family response regulator
VDTYASAESFLRSGRLSTTDCRAPAVGAVEFLEKPFRNEELLGAIERALRAAPP